MDLMGHNLTPSDYLEMKGAYMSNGIFNVPTPQNEPVFAYAPGSPEREKLEKALESLQSDVKEIPVIVGGEAYYTGIKKPCIQPHDHTKILAYYHEATEELVDKAITSALEAKKEWEMMPYKHRVGVFLKAAELISTTWRYKMNAATMLCQSKSAYQAEIDSVCELIDFLRFNAYFLDQIYKEQANSSHDTWNRINYTGLDGFVYAVSPFNFTAIGGNLPSAPAMAGNVVLWKPASTAVYSNYMVMELLIEAGIPKGVINFLPGNSSMITNKILQHRDFSGFHYTGSTNVFSQIWTQIGNNIKNYKTYPRIVGETGGKNFVFAHESADYKALSIALIRGAFEYQGQKCSAASRAYIPRSLWQETWDHMKPRIEEITVGPVTNFKNFMNAVIDEKAFDKIAGYIEEARASDRAEILLGGTYDKTKGYFIDPTVILTTDPKFKTMEEEIFGPVLTIYIYENEAFVETVKLCETTSEYGLTGAIFARDRNVLNYLENILGFCAGNFYINDKPTGAVVGQQPFGGAKASGTNDKAGSKLNLFRWMNMRLVKENFSQIHDYKYPFMG